MRPDLGYVASSGTSPHEITKFPSPISLTVRIQLVSATVVCVESHKLVSPEFFQESRKVVSLFWASNEQLWALVADPAYIKEISYTKLVVVATLL